MAATKSRKSKRPSARKRVVAKRRPALRNGKRSVTIERFEREGWLVRMPDDQFMVPDTDRTDTEESLSNAIALVHAYLAYTADDFAVFVEREGFDQTRW